MKQSQQPPWTILRVLRWAREYLEAKGISEPRAAAEVLLAHGLGLRRIDLYLRHEQPLTSAELARFKSLLRRRLAREPTQYITGHQEFWSLDFLVSPAVLIPRPETEILVEEVVQFFRRAGQLHPLILEVGTGSGAVAVALARELPASRLIASDYTAAAVALARTNARRHQVADRLAFVVGDLLAPFRPSPVFDAIVANAPYIPTAELDQLAPEIRDYEPRLALDGGPDGLGVLRRLIAAAPDYLKPQGLLALEIGQDQYPAVEELLTATGVFPISRLRRDYQHLPRVVLAQRGATPPWATGERVPAPSEA